MRIQKFLSEKGITSRRKAEEWIKEGLVLVNGEKITDPATQIDPEQDEVIVSPRALCRAFRYILYYKPAGIVTVNAGPEEKEIRDILSLPPGVAPVGRLDKESSGLIFLTDDGVVARRIKDPEFKHEKEYEVCFDGPVSDEAVKTMSGGMYFAGTKHKPVNIERTGKSRLSITLTEGKNRQIRRMARLAGLEVKSLKRIRILNFKINSLCPGKMRELSRDERRHLLELLGIGRDTVAEEGYYTD